MNKTRVLFVAGLALFATAYSAVSLYRHVMRGLYPIKYGSAISLNAARTGISPHLIAAVIRVESGFNPTVRSPKGALGLMQVMEPTARWIAGKLGMPYSPATLLDPDVNIRMGVWYMSQLYEEFGSWAPALAAYNAGRGNVRRWLDENVWSGEYEDVDQIPFLETRVHVRRVMNAYSWYRRIYGEEKPGA